MVLKNAIYGGVTRHPDHKCLYKKWWVTGDQGLLSDEWYDFNDFKEWSLNQGWKRGMRLKRHDRWQPFSPENCEWVEYK